MEDWPMEEQGCGHHATWPAAARVCVHLVEARRVGAPPEYVQRFNGRGLDTDLACEACADAEGAAALLLVCGGCVEWVEEHGDRTGQRGTPEVRERPEPVEAALGTVELPGGVGELLDLQPVVAAAGSVWIGLSSDQGLHRLDLDTGAHERLCDLPLRLEPPADRPRAGGSPGAPWASLRVSPSGGLAAVTVTHGRDGTVVDLASGRETLRLDRSDHHVEHYRFACAFLSRGGRELLVHATDWNRLDVSDARTGELLTGRDPTRYRAGEPRPEHYLDYFHAGLLISPGGSWIADNGWVWHPTGVVTVWSLDAWLDDNVWEPENGGSVRALCYRDYLWDAPLCWLDETTLAVWGLGEDDDEMVPGVRVFDVAGGAEARAFAGPDGPLFHHAGRLYGAASDGLGIWDPSTGERLARVPGFVPTWHHPGTGDLVERRGRRLVRWRPAPA